jgi:hypothetical protein
VALFRRNTPSEPASAPEPEQVGGTRAPKARPTPSRKEAEAARRQRVNRTLTKKEARQEANRQARTSRMKAMAARESAPEKALMRDYIDARFSLGEYLLPAIVVILATTFLSTVWPAVTTIATLVVYVFMLLVMFDIYLMWRGFKKVLAQRLPNASTRGLVMYGMNRCIQIRRFRMPPPRLKRGEAY